MWALDLCFFLVLYTCIFIFWCERKYRTPWSLNSDDSRLDGDGDYSMPCQLETLDRLSEAVLKY